MKPNPWQEVEPEPVPPRVPDVRHDEPLRGGLMWERPAQFAGLELNALIFADDYYNAMEACEAVAAGLAERPELDVESNAEPMKFGATEAEKRETAKAMRRAARKP